MFENITENIIDKLNNNDLGAYIIKKALSGPVYIGFKDNRIGKLRIGDHNERERYGYRWQLRSDIKVPFTDSTKGIQMSIKDKLKAQAEYKKRLKAKRSFYLDQFSFKLPTCYYKDDLDYSGAKCKYYLRILNRV